MAAGLFAMTREQAAAGIALCLEKVKHALGGAEIMCRHGGDEAVAVYLYTVAIEELGKALLIDDLLAKGGGGGSLEVPKQWFGGSTAHKEKFKRACALLPEEAVAYQKIDIGSDSEKIPRGHADRLERGKKYLKICHDMESDTYKRQGVTPPERHKDYVIVHDHDEAKGTLTVTVSSPLPYDAGRAFITLPYDFVTRKNMLYADWDDEKKRWNNDATIGPTKYVRDKNDRWRSVEVDKDESELYPDAVLGAISAFSDAVSAYEWASGARFG